MLRRRLLAVIPAAMLLAVLPRWASASDQGPLVIESWPEDSGSVVRWEVEISGERMRITTRKFDDCFWSCHPTADGVWISPCWYDSDSHHDALARGIELVEELRHRPDYVAAFPRFGADEFDEHFDMWQPVFDNAPSARQLFHRRGIAEELRKRNPELADNLRKSMERAGGQAISATIARR